ncbi:MAG: NADH-quinone oxidoreductase subunit NuoB [Elusimicrobia bacterium]|nr:NADH-quinone oxidoreductase subunit NuoB [Candidatus Liberimonas magnetica]
MFEKTKTLTKSLFAFHVGASACNNCDIEILDCLTPKYDLERFGVVLVGSIRHADILLVTGVVNKKIIPKLKKIYEQAPRPCFVVAIGGCSCSGITFRDSYNFAGPLDKIIPVDAYIPGCPPKPEAIIAGLAKLINSVKS